MSKPIGPPDPWKSSEMNDPLNFTTTNSSRGPNAISQVGDCALDDVPAPLCLIGFDGRFQRVNAAWSRLLGHGPQALVGKSFARFIHPDDAQLLVRQLCDPDLGGSPETFEARFRCGDGRYKWFHCETRPIADKKKPAEPAKKPPFARKSEADKPAAEAAKQPVKGTVEKKKSASAGLAKRKPR